jgi:hypothetical protein
VAPIDTDQHDSSPTLLELHGTGHAPGGGGGVGPGVGPGVGGGTCHGIRCFQCTCCLVFVHILEADNLPNLNTCNHFEHVQTLHLQCMVAASLLLVCGGTSTSART